MDTKKWTILVYLAGDNNLDEDGARDIAEMAKVGSNDDINIIAQFDRAGAAGTQRFYITKGGGYEKDGIENLGETNTGDPNILVDFLEWGIAEYPAERYMAVLWNHGSGWNEDEVYDKALKLRPDKKTLTPKMKSSFREKKIRKTMFSTTIDEILKQKPAVRGILYDDESKDFIDNAEMKKVLAKAARSLPGKRFDIIGFDACLMNTIEVDFQLRDIAKVIVGSEETEPGAGWPYDKILGALAKDPDMSPEDFGKAIVDSYIRSYDRGVNSEPVTMSAVNLDKIDDVMSGINKWAMALKKNITKKDAFYNVLQCGEVVQKFYYQTYKDTFDFAKLMNESSKIKEIQAASEALMDVLEPGDDNFVIASKTLTPNMANAHGVSIYFPGRQSYLKYYNKLDFSKKSKWDDFIKAYQKAYDTIRGK